MTRAREAVNAQISVTIYLVVAVALWSFVFLLVGFPLVVGLYVAANYHPA